MENAKNKEVQTEQTQPLEADGAPLTLGTNGHAAAQAADPAHANPHEGSTDGDESDGDPSDEGEDEVE